MLNSHNTVIKDYILCTGKFTRCNYWMKWQDENGKIYNYPVFEINSTQYNSGVSGDKTMTLGSSQHLITITADENTIHLNHGKRIFWDRNKKNPTVFKITQNDTTAMNYDKGLLKITVTEDEYKAVTDSMENWICDYIETSTITILYSGSPTVRTGGTKSLRVDTNESIEWSLESEVNATITAEGNNAKVICSYNVNSVDKKINVIAKSSNGFVGECILTVSGGV